MKKLLIVIALISGTATNLAFAGDVPAKPNENHHGSLHHSCRMIADMHGMRLGFGLGAQYMSERGEIHCVDMRLGQEREVRVPVKIRIIGAGIGFDFTIVRNVPISSGGVGCVHDPMDLTGSFTVGKSAGVTMIKLGYGLGARLHGTLMNV